MNRVALVLLMLLAPVAAKGDWLVMRDRRRIETIGAWRVDGDRVRCAVLDGHGSAEFLSLPAAEVDIERSRAETAARAPRPSPGLGAPVSSGAFLEGWDDWVLEGLRKPRSAELRLNLGGERWDNLMQASADGAREAASAMRSDLRLTLRLLPRTPLKSYVEVGQLRYDARPTATGYGAGVGLDGDRHALHLTARIDRNRPSADIGDAVDAENDILGARLRYALRTRRLEAWLGGDRFEQRFAASPSRNSRQQGLQAGILYYVAGRKLAPELNVGWARLGAAVSSEDYEQRRLALGLRYNPWRIAGVTARVEQTARTYATTDPRSRNFGRRDTRLRWSVGAQLRLTRHAAWTALYDNVGGDSSRAGRDFTAWNVSTGVTVRLGSTAGPADRPVRGPRAPRSAPTASKR